MVRDGDVSRYVGHGSRVGAGWCLVGGCGRVRDVRVTCYAWRRMMAVPGVAEGRADSVRASVACGGVCALVSAVLVVGVGVFM